MVWLKLLLMMGLGYVLCAVLGPVGAICALAVVIWFPL